MRTENEKYCFSCGEVIDSKLDTCPKCGVQQPDVIKNRVFNSEWLAALLLCWILGVFGVHRFYMGRIGTGILMLITFGGLGIWYIIDLILIITGGLRNSRSELVKPYLNS